MQPQPNELERVATEANKQYQHSQGQCDCGAMMKWSPTLNVWYCLNCARAFDINGQEIEGAGAL